MSYAAPAGENSPPTSHSALLTIGTIGTLIFLPCRRWCQPVRFVLGAEYCDYFLRFLLVALIFASVNVRPSAEQQPAQ